MVWHNISNLKTLRRRLVPTSYNAEQRANQCLFGHLVQPNLLCLSDGWNQREHIRQLHYHVGFKPLRLGLTRRLRACLIVNKPEVGKGRERSGRYCNLHGICGSCNHWGCLDHVVYLGLGMFPASERSVLRLHTKTALAATCCDRRSWDYYRFGHRSGLEPFFILSSKTTGKRGTSAHKLTGFALMLHPRRW
jgi:hypothetical protein